MTKTVRPIPEGYHTFTPYLILDNCAKAIEFYTRAFAAKELFRMPGANGKIMHAEIQIGDSRLMLADEFPEMGARSPKSIGGCPITLHLYVESVDFTIERAIAAGATAERPIQNQFYGDRSGSVKDPFGYSWHVATHVEDVSPEELEKRAKQHKC